VIAFPFFGFLTVYYLMASILIIHGAAYIIAGITGAVYVPMGLGLAGGGSRSFWESDATQVSNYLPTNTEVGPDILVTCLDSQNANSR
jgi:hypothetical protein